MSMPRTLTEGKVGQDSLHARTLIFIIEIVYTGPSILEALILFIFF